MHWILIFWLASPYSASLTPVIPKTEPVYDSPEACLAAGDNATLRKEAVEQFVGYSIGEFSCSIGGK